MNISRNFANVVRFIIDELVPPILRDRKWFMWLPFKLIFGSKSDEFFNFKEQFHTLSDAEISDIYEKTADVHISRDTDLNQASINKIKSSIKGRTVLDAGCGRGFLTNLLHHKYDVVGVDFVKSGRFEEVSPGVKFVEAPLTELPFEDDGFDTVICSHTLEHVKNITKAISELRRVAKKNLIIVVPKQRPYRYTFDLHVHFFPYLHDFLNLVSTSDKFPQQIAEEIDGDIYYQEFLNDEFEDG